MQIEAQVRIGCRFLSQLHLRIYDETLIAANLFFR